MITLRRAQERHDGQRHEQQVWQTFPPRGRAGLTSGFGILEGLTEHRLPPGAVSAAPLRQEAEIVTYVFEGALAQEDSTGSSGVVCAGEFQRLINGRGVHFKETNASRTDWAHVYRICLRPTQMGLDCAHEVKRFATALRHNVLCVVASQDGRNGSLRILQDALIMSSVLDPGHHIVHELIPGRSAWLHVICGEANLDDLILARGDGVGVAVERSVSLTAQEKTEVLLVDLGPTLRSGASVCKADHPLRVR
jgi:redox-sensitive bicupin YhaK (pirin superfamily)